MILGNFLTDIKTLQLLHQYEPKSWAADTMDMIWKAFSSNQIIEHLQTEATMQEANEYISRSLFSKNLREDDFWGGKMLHTQNHES